MNYGKGSAGKYYNYGTDPVSAKDVENMLKGILIKEGDLADGSVTSLKIRLASIEGAHIQDASINNAHIQNLAVGRAQIQDLSVNSAKIDNLAVSSAKIDDLAVTEAKIDNASITTAKIQDLAVVTAKIGDAAITTAKIAEASIGTAHIIDATITTAKIQDAAITNVQIANASIDRAKIIDGEIVSAKIGDAAITTAKIETGSITTALIAEGAIGSVQIGEGSITDAHIVSLVAGKILSGTLDTGQVTVAGDNGKLMIKNNRLQVFDNQTVPVERVSLGDVNDNGTLYGFRVRGEDGTTVLYDEKGVYNEGITDGAITNPKIGSGEIENKHIVGDTITGDKMIADAITAREIKARVITANHLVANTITAASGVIADLAVTNAKIADATIQSAKIINLDADKLTAGTVIAEDITFTGHLQGATGTFSGELVTNNLFVKSTDTLRSASLSLQRMNYSPDQFGGYFRFEQNPLDMYQIDLVVTNTTGQYVPEKAALHVDGTLSAKTIVGPFTGRNLFSIYNRDMSMVTDHDNGNVSINAVGQYLYLGLYNTTQIRLGSTLNTQTSDIITRNLVVNGNISADDVANLIIRTNLSSSRIYLQANHEARATLPFAAAYIPMRALSHPAESTILIKQNIEDFTLDEAYYLLNQTNIVKYHLNHNINLGIYDKPKIGIISEMSPAVYRDENGVDTYSIISSLYKVVQHQDKRIARLEEQVEDLLLVI